MSAVSVRHGEGLSILLLQVISVLCARLGRSFVVQKSKVSTARVTMWKELNIPSVFSIEASFLGPTTVALFLLTTEGRCD
jgi:hypothetical protein